MEELQVDKEYLDQLYNINGKLLTGKVGFADLQIKLEEHIDHERVLLDRVEELQNNIDVANMEIEDLRIKMDLIKSQKEELKNAIAELTRAFHNNINEIAKSYGIENSEEATWSFDFSAGKFIQVKR